MSSIRKIFRLGLIISQIILHDYHIVHEDNYCKFNGKEESMGLLENILERIIVIQAKHFYKSSYDYFTLLSK